jgi:uncharacterized protein (TIGR00369 family)
MSSPLASSQARAFCAGVAPTSGGHLYDLIGNTQVALEVLTHESWARLAPVIVGQLVHRPDGARQKPWPSGADIPPPCTCPGDSVKLDRVLHAPNTPLGRFGMETLVDSPDPFVGTIPMSGLVNPLTGTPTVAPLAVLVDFVAGLVNHYRRAPDEWTVSSELSLALAPNALDSIAQAPDVPVVGTARPFGTKGSTSLGVCELTHHDAVLGVGTVRSVHIAMPGEFPPEPDHPAADGRPTELAEIMALRVEDGALFQSPNPILNNSMGIVHGGVAAAGLELAASAALNAGRADDPLDTASVSVNYLRPFRSSTESHYTAEVFRNGRRSGVADSKAISTDGDVALIARVTAYR